LGVGKRITASVLPKVLNRQRKSHTRRGYLAHFGNYKKFVDTSSTIAKMRGSSQMACLVSGY